MLEDDIYRTSTQYRYWSYTPQALAAVRASTNATASDRVRSAIKRLREKRQSQGDGNGAENGGNDATSSSETEIECLTVEEELKLVRWGCSRIVDMGEAMEPPIPFEIRATAIQFLRRFYLTNSPMTYHPKQIMMCALFLATKTDHYHIGLSRFVSKLPKTTEDDIKAPEFLLMQGLRFTLDVRHPMKGLEGGMLEIRLLAGSTSTSTSAEFTKFMQDHPSKETQPQRRIDAAEYYSRKILSTSAQMTDAYFLYTPSQIWLAALTLADEPLANFYLDFKVSMIGPLFESIRPKVLTILKSCAELLREYKSDDEDPSEKKDLKRIGKKLHLCQNPDKVDLVELNRAQKRESAESSDAADKALKKRKLERGRLERDGDVFGGELKKNTTTN